METKVTATYSHASGGTYTDTETTIEWQPGSSTVTATVTCLPGLVYWGRPSADVMRKWVDETIHGHGIKRNGARMELNPRNGWIFTYPIKPSAGLDSLI